VIYDTYLSIGTEEMYLRVCYSIMPKRKGRDPDQFWITQVWSYHRHITIFKTS